MMLEEKIVRYLLVQSHLEDWPSGRRRVADYDDTQIPQQAKDIITIVKTELLSQLKELALPEMELSLKEYYCFVVGKVETLKAIEEWIGKL